MKIILDAMGGDNAPQAIVDGGLAALELFDDISIVFTGKKDEIEKVLSDKKYDKSRLEIINASEVIEMNDHPAQAIRSKKDSSMVVGFNALCEDKGDIFISAGNTGALVAGATLIVKRAKGVKRPPIASQIPSKTGSVLLIDAGANVDCKPVYLEQFAVMGSIYMKNVMDIESPRVGLVNNGGEEEKGSSLTKEAYQLIKNTNVNFVGNAEGRDLLSGNYDVIVCDGFTGNIILKFLEGTASVIMGALKKEIMSSIMSKIGAVFMKKAFRGLKKRFDYSEYGGALLLGLNKGVIKAHGSSDSKAICSAVRVARKCVLGNVVEKIKEEIENIARKEDE